MKIKLSAEEKARLAEFINSGTAKAREIKHANVLLKLAVGWKQNQIAEAFSLSERTVIRIKKRFEQEGVEAALVDKARSGGPKKLTGEVKAVIVATACSQAPQGHTRWSLRLLAAKMLELAVVDQPISHNTVGEILKKTNSNPGKNSSGVSQALEPNS
ncbi:MAG: helix-turn-helix domain-containing protein [Microcystaceae cyanobacterium]